MSNGVLVKILAGIICLVALYYAGTRGVFVLTRRYKGRWQRKAIVSLVLAVLFTPSIVGIGGPGEVIVPIPAWMAAISEIQAKNLESGFVDVCLIALTWFFLFVIAAMISKRD